MSALRKLLPLLCALLLTSPLCGAQDTSTQEPVKRQNVSGNPLYTTEAPPGYAMMGDLLFARPLLIGLTALGTAAWVVTLPFTALGGNVEEAGEALVIAPAKSAFVRCLGCAGNEYKD